MDHSTWADLSQLQIGLRWLTRDSALRLTIFRRRLTAQEAAAAANKSVRRPSTSKIVTHRLQMPSQFFDHFSEPAKAADVFIY